jgi:aspartate carbamoyltransferase catalytic subunit
LLTLADRFKQNLFDTSVFGRKPVVATSFLENSTRTKHSFTTAIHRLGCHYIDFNAETSSLKKGENLEETLLTLWCQGIELCIIRSSETGLLQPFKNSPPIKIVNGGDGIGEHPTQALLDLMTMKELGMDLAGKTVSIIGDLVHSRVGHSLIELLSMFDMSVILCGPSEYLPAQEEYPNLLITTDLKEAVLKSDILYTLRIQRERHGNSDDASGALDYHEQYGLNLAKLKSWNKMIPIFHPGPVNIGVELADEILKSELYKGYEQVVNSTYMRMAILLAMLQNNDSNVGVAHIPNTRPLGV